MYKILLPLIFLSLSLLSCSNKPSPEHQAWLQHRNDSIRQDSINKQIIIDSLSLIAIGDAKFGMTLEEIRNTDFFKKAYFWKTSATMNLNLYGDNYELEALFAKDTLYKIRLETEGLSANYIDVRLNRIANNLGEAFTEKYGKPDYERRKLDILDLKRAYTQPMYEWKIGDKYIMVGMYAYESKSLYRIKCIIENEEFKKIAEREKEEEREATKAERVNPL